MSRNGSKDMTEGSPFNLILMFTIPVLIGNLFQQLYSMVDTIIVGQFIGTDALAAVGSTGSLNFLVNGFSTGLAGGFAVIPAQCFGARNEKALKKSVGQAVILCLFFTLLLTILAVNFTKPVLRLMNTPDNIFEDATVYILTIFYGICATVLYNMCACILRALGDSKTPLYFLILASFVNIGLDLLFIIVFKWRVFGAAFATIISQALSGFLCFVHMARKYDIIHLSKEDLVPDFSLIGKHLSIGLPMAFQFSITAIGTVVLQGALNSFGSAKIAAFTAGCKVEQLVTQIGPSVGVTMANYCGQNLGAGKIDRIKRGVTDCTIMTLILAVLSAVFLHFAGGSIAGLFITGENPAEVAEVVSDAVVYIDTIIIFFPALYMIFIYRNALQGMGRSFMPLMAGVFELIARCVVSVTLPGIMGYLGVCYAGPAAWIAAMVPLCITYFIVISRMTAKNKLTPGGASA